MALGNTSRVGLSDLLRAWSTLDVVGFEEAREIAALLGYDMKRPERQTSSDEWVLDSSGGTKPSQHLASREVTHEPEPPEAPPDSGEDVLLSFDRVAPPPLPSWWDQRETVGHHLRPAPVRHLILSPSHRTEVVLSMGRGFSAYGEVDAERLVELLARGAFPNRIPRHWVRSISYDVHLLIDRRDAMTPFREDAQSLARDFEQLLGNRLSRHVFVSSPLRVGGFF